MAVTSASSLQDRKDAAVAVARSPKGNDVVRWHLMIYPYGRKGLLVGLEREVVRRKNAGEPPIEYFAPVYVEAKEVDGKIVRTEKLLYNNYVFVKASVRELFKMKQYEGQYNFPHRRTNSLGEVYYPYVTDETIESLKWIARSYSGSVPVYTGDTSWLMKGDRVRITSGPFKGIEANLFENCKRGSKEIMVSVDEWLSVPLLNLKEGQYKVIALNEKSERQSISVDDTLMQQLHEALCRYHKGELSPSDVEMAKSAIARYASLEPDTAVLRCKYYALMLTACTIMGEREKRENFLGIANTILPALGAEQSKALLLTTLYGCTDDSLFYNQAHAIIDHWQQEEAPKKSKRTLIQRLKDYDQCLGH